jgi:hypothetical protein
MENSTNLFNTTVNDSNLCLFILFNEILFTYDGSAWSQLYISDINLPGTDFRFLKKPSLVEISPLKNANKSFLVSGGFNPVNKSFSKTNFVINIIKSDTNSFDCLLDFKYSDMTTNRFLHAGINLENKFVILIGGKNEKGWLNTCEYLNLSTGEWKEFPPMNSSRANFDSLLFSENNKHFIYVYGGYSGVGKFVENLIEICEVNIKTMQNSKWTALKIKSETANLPKIAMRMVRYDDNILIIGGSDGKHLLNNIFELDTQGQEINSLGNLNTPRNNFHLFYREGEVYLVGGSCKDFKYKEDFIENYSEKIYFNLASKIESNDMKVSTDIFLFSLQNFSINPAEFYSEPGFPYYSSLISTKLS